MFTKEKERDRKKGVILQTILLHFAILLGFLGMNAYVPKVFYKLSRPGLKLCSAMWDPDFEDAPC